METISKTFKLGYCRCGCGKHIPIKRPDGGILSKYKRGHYPHSGKLNPMWKGGRKKTFHGYIDILRPEHPKADCNGYVKEHRFVWEQHNKACLLSWGDVHHKNHIKDDNRIENLEVMMTHKHAILHNRNRVDMTNRFCLICGSESTNINQDGTPAWYIYNGGHRCGKCYRHEYYVKQRALYDGSNGNVKL